MALDRLTKVDGGGINTTSDYRVGIITASKFVGPFDGTGGNFTGVVTATDGNFSGNVTIGGTLTYEDVTNIDSVGIITAQKDIHVGAGLSVVGVSTFSGITTVTGNTLFAKQLNVSGVSTFGNTIVGTNATFSGNINNSPVGNGSISGFGAITIEAPTPALNFTETDANPDYRIIVLGGQFRIQDVTNSNANRFIINTDGTTSIEKNLNCSSDLDVDGHTNLDNVSIAGVVTATSFSGPATQVSLAAQSLDTDCYPVFSLDATGNQALYTKSNRLSFNSATGALSATSFVGDLTIPDSIVHDGDTDTKIVFTDNNIDFQAAGSSRLKVTQYAVYVQSSLPLAFLASSGATPNIKSGGTDNQDLLFTSGSGNPTRLQIRSDGAIFLTHPNVNINRGTSGAGYPLTVRGPSTGDIIRLERANSGQWHFGFDGSTNFKIKSNTTEVVHISNTGAIRNQRADANASLTLSRNASVTTTDQPIAVVDFASNTAHTVQARIMGKTRGTSNVGGDLVVETRAEGGSLDERVRIDGSGRVLIGGSSNSASSHADELQVINTSAEGGISIINGTSSTGHIYFGDTDAAAQGRIDYNHGGDYMRFYAANVERLRIENVNSVRARFNFGALNGDFTNPDIGGGTAGVSINKNTVGQIYACTDNADNTAANDYQTVVLNVSRRNTSGDGPHIALDRGGWIKASIAGLQGSNTATSGPGSFAIYTHDYSSGQNVRTQRFIIQSDGRVTIGDGNNLAQDFVTNMLIDGGDNSKLSIYGSSTGSGTIAFPDSSSSGAERMAGFIQMNHTSTDNGPRLNMGLNDTTLVHIRVPGSNRGQLEVYGNFNESTNPAIEISDGGDARKVFITNSSGDLNLLTRNGSQTKGQLKMFESGVFFHAQKDPDSTNVLQTFRAQTYRNQTGSTNPSTTPDQTLIQKGGSGTYDCFYEGNMTLEVNGGGNDHYQPVAFVPLGYDLDTSSFGGQWAGEMWIHQTGSQNPTSFGYSGYNTWATMSFKCRWDSAHWNAKPNGFWVEHYINQGRAQIGKIDASSTMSQFVIYLLPGQYRIRYNCVRGMSVHRSSSDGGSITLRDGGSFATYSTLAYSSRNTSFDSEISPGSANQAYTT